jgi:hypothetical protein
VLVSIFLDATINHITVISNTTATTTGGVMIRTEGIAEARRFVALLFQFGAQYVQFEAAIVLSRLEIALIDDDSFQIDPRRRVQRGIPTQHIHRTHIVDRKRIPHFDATTQLTRDTGWIVQTS